MSVEFVPVDAAANGGPTPMGTACGDAFIAIVRCRCVRSAYAIGGLEAAGDGTKAPSPGIAAVPIERHAPLPTRKQNR